MKRPRTATVDGDTWQIPADPARLGKGGFASVVQATSAAGRLAAVKIFKAGDWKEETRDLQERELKMYRAAGTHQHIVGCMGGACIGGRHLLFMEIVRGGDLLDRVMSRTALEGALHHTASTLPPALT